VDHIRLLTHPTSAIRKWITAPNPVSGLFTQILVKTGNANLTSVFCWLSTGCTPTVTSLVGSELGFEAGSALIGFSSQQPHLSIPPMTFQRSVLRGEGVEAGKFGVFLVIQTHVVHLVARKSQAPAREFSEQSHLKEIKPRPHCANRNAMGERGRGMNSFSDERQDRGQHLPTPQWCVSPQRDLGEATEKAGEPEVRKTWHFELPPTRPPVKGVGRHVVHSTPSHHLQGREHRVPATLNLLRMTLTGEEIVKDGEIGAVAHQLLHRRKA